jgi:hypothetical protein
MGVLFAGTSASAAVGGTTPTLENVTITATDPSDASVNDTVQFTIAIGTPPTPTGTAFPLLAAGRIGEKNYGTNTPRFPAVAFTLNEPEQAAMARTHFSVINPQSSRGSGFVEAAEEFITYRDNNKPNHVIFLYQDMQEISPTGANATKVESEVGPNGTRDWWLYEDADTGVIASTFTGLNHVNVTTNVTVDSGGLIFPEWYADNNTQDTLDLYQTTVETPRVHIYNDVTDHRARSDNMDYNADGITDQARSDWNTDATTGKTQSGLMREGHRMYFDRIRQNNHDDILVICNNTTWSAEYSGTNINDMFIGSGVNGIHSHYDGAVDGGWMEGLIATNFPLSGVKAANNVLTIQSFGSWRLAQNACMYLEAASKGPNYTLNHWGTFVEIDGSDQAGQINPIVGGLISSEMMALYRWGFASSLLGNNYHYCDNAATPHNMTIEFDESGVVNTSTTGLSFEWLGAPLEASQLEKELASGASSVWLGTDDSGIFKREFENGIVLVNTTRSLTGSIDVPVTAVNLQLTLESGVWKHIQGHQDPSVNDGSVVTTATGLTIPSLDGIVLERV